ncbi:hypothetical protein FACS1894192_00630 [Bacilli bacterium]|nr:hypothetical protein FACS1894192_00630 [Bacilli bacterium]
MSRYAYENHLNKVIYFTNDYFEPEHCDFCLDCDYYIGKFDTFEEFVKEVGQDGFNGWAKSYLRNLWEHPIKQPEPNH